MRLLQRDDDNKYSLCEFAPDYIPPYAILSHTWGRDEVVFADIAKAPGDWQYKASYDKIKFSADQARRDGLRYFWVDTCCIDKSDCIDLQTAINSMFRWYRDAKRCYVYLPDVSCPRASSQLQTVTLWEDAFRKSRWFQRGWTLQELIAPKTVDFYSEEQSWLGDKRTLEPLIRDITGIPVGALRGTPLSDFTVKDREAWVGNRQTKYEEDMAYSLLGLFDVHMPLIYGEGREKAQRRLREEVQKAVIGPRANDFSISFSLSEVFEVPHFVAREREIAEIRRTLSSDGSRRVVVLHGLGGIGKTQLAVAYTKRYRDEYSAIFWFNIKDEASIQQSFTRVARQLMQQHPDTSRLTALDLQENNNKVVEAVQTWLSLPGNTRWLAIYDNYDNPKLADRPNDDGINIHRFLPLSYQGSIIVTTRLSQVDIGHRILIRKLESTDDSLKILSTTSGRYDLHDDVDAKALAEKLDGLPLALATAGAYLRRVSTSFSDYLRLYQSSWASLHTSIPRLGSYGDRTLCSTWQVSYEQVQEQNPLAAHLLQWWAYFDNEDVWFELLQTDDDNVLPWMYELNEELNFNNAMGTLHDYGFVEPHSLGTDLIESRGYSIHGCLHSWTIHVLNQCQENDLGKLAVERVASRVTSQDDVYTWLLQRRLLSHAMISCATLQSSDEDVSWALHNLGNLFANQNKIQEAKETYLRALRGYERGPGHTSTLSTINNLGLIYVDEGKPQEAEKMFLRALRGYKTSWGLNHTSTLRTVNNLARLYASHMKPQKAESMYLWALEGYETAGGPNHPSTLHTVNSLGLVYVNEGKPQEAETMFLRALRGYETIYEPDHMSTLSTVSNLGLLYASQGKLREAEDMYRRALGGYEKVLGAQVVASYRPAIHTMWGLGALMLDLGKPVEARTYHQRAYDNLQALLGPLHKSVQSLRNILLVFDQTIQVSLEE
ncbi:putative Tetratricopeptide repeat domain protein [Seiridium unicorne]|uniref:Tetratricopeptide repeat domain protein n=1 Tax=Seiridium unicorne TaxID=138068 RepID=A0ABR2VAH0_9PEZI